MNNTNQINWPFVFSSTAVFIVLIVSSLIVTAIIGASYTLFASLAAPLVLSALLVVVGAGWTND